MSRFLSVGEAQQRLQALAGSPPQGEMVALSAALGRVVAVDVTSSCDVPPAANSAMDGYALRLQDIQQAGEPVLPVSQRIAAGTRPAMLEPGTAARIFTGAEIPAGADCVVMQENCSQDGDRVRILQVPQAAANIRPRGQDIARGETVVSRGIRLAGTELGLLASTGVAQVEVYRRLRVALLSTGDELREPGAELGPGEIYNSNRYLLRGLLETMGVEVVDYGCVEDTLDATVSVLARAADECDCVLSTGGVSVGEEDHVKAALEQLGQIDFWKIAIKPGKPLACGLLNARPFFGLPGNPVSAFVTFLVVIKPALATMQGLAFRCPRQWPVRAGFEQSKVAQRDEYLRVRLEEDAQGHRAVPLPNQSSGVLSSCSAADALLIIKAGSTVRQDELLPAILLDQLIYC